MAPITIDSKTIDPAAEDAAPEYSSLDASESNYILIQCDERLDSEKQDELLNLHVQIQKVVAEDDRGRCTYLCRFEPADLTAIQNKPFVVHALTYPQDFVVEAELEALISGGGHEERPSESQGWFVSYNQIRVSAVKELRDRSPDTAGIRKFNFLLADLAADSRVPRADQKVDVYVFLHEDADHDTSRVHQQITEMGYAEPGRYGESELLVTANPQNLKDIAALDSVRKIERVVKPVNENDFACGITGASNITVNTVPFHGEGQIVTITDDGFDIGDIKNTHPTFTGRVKKIIPLAPRKPPSDIWGHGTHVAGIAVGSWTGTFQETSADGTTVTEFIENLSGSAPAAELLMQTNFGANGKIIDVMPLSKVYDDPYALYPQARIHSISQGKNVREEKVQSPYKDSDAGVIDGVVWLKDDLLIVRSAGNYGTVLQNVNTGAFKPSIGGWAAAKNCITIGNSSSTRPSKAGKYDKTGPNGNPQDIVPSSSKGPTVEKRRKPDIVAPGAIILSAQSQDPKCPLKTKTGVPPDPKFWTFKTGTSMATPHVAGCAAVLREVLVKGTRPNPSASLLKAIIMHGASSCAGGKYGLITVGNPPDNVQGFGRMNLTKAVEIALQADTDVIGLEDFRKSAEKVRRGGSVSRDFTVKERKDAEIVQEVALKITLVWNDPPGKDLQNQLKFSVKAFDGTEWHGNQPSKAISAEDKKVWDKVNNVQQIVWPNIPLGKTTWKVSGDVVLNGKPQGFAVVWTLDYTTPAAIPDPPVIDQILPSNPQIPLGPGPDPNPEDGADEGIGEIEIPVVEQ